MRRSGRDAGAADNRQRPLIPVLLEHMRNMAWNRSFMPAAHLVHGYLGAGKSTFARQLERNIPAIRFSHDEWMVRFYGNDPPIEHFQDSYRRVHEQVEEIWLRCLELGLDVVLDFGFWTRWERDATDRKIIALGAEAFVYRLTCSEDEAWRRIEKRNVNLQGSLL